MKAAVTTISDSAARGERVDLSGPRVAELLCEAGFEVVETKIIPDELTQIEAAIIEACAKANLVVTTGGTGIARRDVTPEATRAVCERLVEGIPELMRAEGSRSTQKAALSRAVCGIRGTTLVLNLPGSPQGAEESLGAVLGLLPHMVELLQGKTGH